MSSSCFELMWPGSGFVVEGAGLETAVQDTYESIGELAQGGVVAATAGSFGDRSRCGHPGIATVR